MTTSSNNTGTSTPNSTTSSLHHNVVPSEVGWQFVPQYYTFVNKHPNRLHCFYTKASTFIHGTEGEDGKPCYGQQEIHNKITSIGFQDCKVFIHSVDAQSSANGGIIIQVIGEMSNHGDPWRKFVQTFFLAEQPNGYFVLNDIFRFLKEETVEGEDENTDEVEAAAAEPQPTAPAPAPEPVAEPPAPSPAPPTPEPEPAQTQPAPAPVEEPPTTVIPEPIAPTPEPTPPQKVNGVHSTATPEPEPTPAPAQPAREPTPEPPTPAPSAPTPARTATPSQQPPATTSQPAPPPSQPPAQPAQPAAPPAPKTWANLAATNSKKWGSAVATESRGTSEVPASPATSGTQTPVRDQPGPRPIHPSVQQVQQITTAQCFVKGVVEPLSQSQLHSTLTQRFGPIKDQIEIVRSKACAFLEFQNLDSAKRAIIASLPVNQGGEGGVRIDVGGDVGNVRISIETRKERGDRPVSRPRGGAPVNGGEQRGGFQRGRGAPGGGRGRGSGQK